jgi:hypothetical protein
VGVRFALYIALVLVAYHRVPPFGRLTVGELGGGAPLWHGSELRRLILVIGAFLGARKLELAIRRSSEAHGRPVIPYKISR